MRKKPSSFFLSALLGTAAILLLPTSVDASTFNYSSYSQWRALMFDTSLGKFESIAKEPDNRPKKFDWSTDYCSAPLVGSTGLTFDFSAACRRHDFGYRNVKSLTYMVSAEQRREIDEQFRSDLRYSCSKRSIWQRPTCYAWSETFYRVVRLVAGP